MPALDETLMPIEDGVIPMFSRKAVKNEFESNRLKHPVFFDVDQVVIFSPGDKWSQATHVVRKFISKTVDGKQEMDEIIVRPDIINRFPKAWDAYVKGVAPDHGTPLKSVNWLSESQRAVLAVSHIHTLEALAACSDSNLDNLGHGGRDLRDKARKQVGDNGVSRENAELKNQLADQAARMARLEALLDVRARPVRKAKKAEEEKPVEEVSPEEEAPEPEAEQPAAGPVAAAGFSRAPNRELPPHMQGQ